jgi:hypothetical protein
MKDPVQDVKVEEAEKIQRGSSFFSNPDSSFNQSNQRLVEDIELADDMSSIRIVRNK